MLQTYFLAKCRLPPETFPLRLSQELDRQARDGGNDCLAKLSHVQLVRWLSYVSLNIILLDAGLCTNQDQRALRSRIGCLREESLLPLAIGGLRTG